MTIPSAPDPPSVDARLARLRAPLLAELRPGQAGAARHARRLAHGLPIPPRRSRIAGVAVLACALALAAGSAALLVRSTSPALAVSRSEGVVELRIADVSAGAAELTRELQAAGIPGEVRVIPVPEPLAGTWAAISERADPPGTAPRGVPDPEAAPEEETVRLSRIGYEAQVLRLPVAELRETTGWFVLYAGRAARPGEEVAFDGRFFTGPHGP